jgi:predicted DNA-binding ribbon-helix-helix protein
VAERPVISGVCVLLSECGQPNHSEFVLATVPDGSFAPGLRPSRLAARFDRAVGPLTVRALLVDPGAKIGCTDLRHYNYTANRVIFATLQTFCATALVKDEIFVLCRKSTTDGGCCMKSPVVKRSIVLAGHKTSVSLEDEFWRGLKEIAGKRLVTLSTLVDTIDAQRQQGNLSSALRLFVLEFYRSQIPEVEGREGLRELMDRPKPVLS